MNPTPEQMAVIDYDLKSGSALKVISPAGSGKTSMLAEYSRAHIMDQVLYLCYNKSAQVDAERRFPGNTMSRTIHSMAYQAIGRKFENLGNLMFFHITKFLSVDVYRAVLVGKTIDNWCNSADPTIDEVHVPPDVLSRFEAGYEGRIVEAADRIWKLMVENEKFPMTHSGYLKLYQLSKPILSQNTILMDEAQDSNPVTIDIVLRQRDHGAGIILVGDPFQQIYEWRGAVDAMTKIDCPALYLTKSFRFGPRVASVANKLLGTFFPDVKPIIGHDIDDRLVENHGDAPRTIICRTNSELFRSADFAAASGKHVGVVGVLKFENFMDKIQDVYHLYKGNRHLIKEKQTAFFRSYADLVKFAQDRLDPDLSSRVNIVNDYNVRIPEVLERIRRASVGGPESAQVLLVTGHSAKGLEWDNVSLASDFAELFDDACVPFSTLGPETIERGEINLLYVASTRAKRQLQLNDELRRLMSYVPAEGRSGSDPKPDESHTYHNAKPNSEADDMTDTKQIEEEFGS